MSEINKTITTPPTFVNGVTKLNAENLNKLSTAITETKSQLDDMGTRIDGLELGGNIILEPYIPKENFLPLHDVVIDPKIFSIKKGEEKKIDIIFYPYRATNKNKTIKVSNPSIVKISDDYIVTGLSAGTTSITVTTTEGGKTDYCTVEVVDDGSIYGQIVLSKTSTTIIEGGSDTFTVKLDKAPTNNQVVTLTKNNNDVTLNPATLTFTSSNWNTAQTITINVAEDDDYTNETCTITLTSPNVANKTVTVNITDNDENPSNIPVQSINLHNSSYTCKVNETLQLTYDIVPTNATNQQVTFNSNNTSIATVTSNGLVTTKSEGECIITVSTIDGNKEDTCAFTVQQSETTPPPELNIPTEGLVYAYNLKQRGSDTNKWADISGNGYDLELKNFTHDSSNGWTDQGLKFNGINNYAIAPKSEFMTDDLSVVYIAEKLESNGSKNEVIYCFGKNGTTERIVREFFNTNATKSSVFIGASTLNSNVDYSLLKTMRTMTTSLDPKKNKLYFDKNLDTENGLRTQPFDFITKDWNLFIGKDSFDGIGRNCVIVLKAFYVYNRVLNIAEIEQIYNFEMGV